MLTKKDLKELARIVGEQYAAEACNKSFPLMTEVMLWCRQDNPRFDKHVFLDDVITYQTQAMERRRNAAR